MKEWITKQIIAFSEITGRPVPRFIRNRVSSELLEQESKKERQLTESLRSSSLKDEQIPSFLVEQLDHSISRGEETPVTSVESDRLIIPVWAMAAAALLVVSVTLFLAYPRERVGDSSELMVSAPPTETTVVELPEATVEKDFPRLSLKSIERELVLKPLVNEQERLASDMTNALQYMADSFLPNQYAEQVNENLVSLKAEISGSI